MAENYNFTLNKGSCLNMRINATDENGTALNLTNYSVRGKVRYRYTSTGVLLDLAPTIVAPASSGIVDIDILPNSTTGLPITQAVYDLEAYTSNDAVVYKFLKGKIDIAPEVTT